jgi:hypothetical protein
MPLPGILQRLEDLERESRNRDMREIERMTSVIRFSNRAMQESLANIEFRNAKEIEEILRNSREASIGKDLIRALDRITKLEISQAGGGIPVVTYEVGSVDVLTPAGYMTDGGAVIAPVSVVGKNVAVPTGAAIVLQLEETTV